MSTANETLLDNLTDDEDKPVRGDMTPMIDLIFLLLIFFILTTRFIPSELTVASLLPTEAGSRREPAVLPKDPIRFAIVPAGLIRGLQPSDYQALANRLEAPRFAAAELRSHGARVPLPVGDDVSGLLTVHDFVAARLSTFERQDAATRAEQDRVEIHCYTGLAWRHALAVYDAVLAFEASRGEATSDAIRNPAFARPLTFAAPGIRNTRSQGDELFELAHLQ